MISLFLNKKIAIAISLGLVLLCLGIGFGPWEGMKPYLKRLEYLLYDIRLQIFPIRPSASAVVPKIVIVFIDDKSLQQEGRWPWPRSKLAALVDKIGALQPTLIVFDMVFSEADPNHDRLFARSIQKNPSVITGFILHGGQSENVGVLTEKSVFQEALDESLPIPTLLRHVGNLPLIQKSVLDSGFMTIFPDEDGVIRRAPLILRYQNRLYPSLALQTARHYLLEKTIRVQTEVQGPSAVVDAVKLGRLRIPTDDKGAVLIPYLPSNQHFLYFSAADVLSQKVEKESFQNAIVLIGTSALGIGDLQATPVQSGMPGSAIQANLLMGIFGGSIPMEPAWITGLYFVTLLGVGVVLSFLLPYLDAVATLLVSAVTLALFVSGNVLAWQFYHFALPSGLLIGLVCLLTLFHLGYGYFGEGRYRRHLKLLFGQYVPREIIEEMIFHPGAQQTFEGESREMTVLFSDIKHFTPLAESLSPKETKRMLQEFLTPMTEIIFKHRGTIDKYVGDMIMAFWGAPLSDFNHADHAIDTALEMLKVLDEVLNPEWKRKGLPTLAIGIGINTGMMNVGDMGSQFRRSYTVIGDTVNVASRLEQLTRMYEVPLIIGEDTYKKQSQFVCQVLDQVTVRGREGAPPLLIYQPLCTKEQLTPPLGQTMMEHESAVNFYLAKEWDKAKAAFEALLQKTGLPVYQVFLNRIQFVKTNPSQKI